MNALRILKAARERTQLQILEFSRELAEQEARDAVEAAMQHRVNVEFNNQAKFIFNWLRRSSKRSQFCRNYKHAWTNICQKKIAGLKILICWHLGVIYRNMKKWIKERMSIGKWINGLNSWLLDNTAAVENDNISETENTLQNDKNSAAASMMRAWNDTAAVENGWISKTENPSQNKTTDKSQNFGSTNLIRGGLNNTAAVSKISCPVIDMTQYSFEDQLDGKQRKIEYMGIRYNWTGPGKNKGKNNNPNKITKYYSCGMIQERRNGPWKPDQQKRGTGTEKTEEEEVNRRKGGVGGNWIRKRIQQYLGMVALYM